LELRYWKAHRYGNLYPYLALISSGYHSPNSESQAGRPQSCRKVYDERDIRFQIRLIAQRFIFAEAELTSRLPYELFEDGIIAAVEKNRFWEYYYWLWDLALNGLKF
jgi:hypothetical protein